jgi:hypothetical protein
VIFGLLDMSFDNLSGIKKTGLNLGLLILFTFLALVFIFLIPGIGFLGAALLPVPASLLIISGRIRDGIICAAAPVLLLLFFDYMLPAVLIAAVISVAFSQRRAAGKDWPAWKPVLVVFFILLGALFLYMLLYLIFYGPGFFTGAFEKYNTYIENLSEDPLVSGYAELLNGSGAGFDAVVSQAQAILRFIPKILPGIIVVSFFVISLLNYLFSYMIFKKFSIEIEKFKQFTGWDVPWYYIWGIIAGLLLVLIPGIGGAAVGSGSAFGSLADILGYNLLVIFGMLYMVLGISVLWGIFERFKIGFLFRILIIIFLWFFFGFALIIFPVLGIIDIWANFRKLKRT